MMAATTTSMASTAPARPPMPWPAVACLHGVPMLLCLQFLLAGLGLFLDARWWPVHAAAGGLAGLPILGLALRAPFSQALRPLRWWTGLQALLHLLQVALGAAGEGGGLALALHPFNGALLLACALVLLAKQRRGQRRRAAQAMPHRSAM